MYQLLRMSTLLVCVVAWSGCTDDSGSETDPPAGPGTDQGGSGTSDGDDGTDTEPPDFGCPAEVPSAAVAYESRYETVLGSRMHYYEAGDPEGPVVLLLHGLPVSAYFWRNVIPHLEDNARVIALDHIGFGKSDRPEGLDFGLEDQVAYLDAFIDAKGIDDITVVGQDLGSWTGMTWASRNPGKVRAIALVEGIIPPLLPASTESTDPNLLGIWLAARDPATAQRMFVDEHFFINVVLPEFTACGPSPEALAVYAEPWADKDSRHILFATPAEIPIDGQPVDHVDSVAKYVEWIQSTDTPKLLVHATPGALMPSDVIEGAKQSMKNVTTVSVGGGIHFLAESKPDEVGAALSDWFDAEVL